VEDRKWVPVSARIAGVRVGVQDVLKKRGVCEGIGMGLHGS